MNSLITRLRTFLTREIWGLEHKTLSALHGFPVKQIRIGYLVVGDLFRGNVQVRAAALTYRTLLSIIPLLALMFVTAKPIGLQHKLLTGVIPTVNRYQTELLQKAVAYIEQTNVQALGIFGVLFLLWMSVLLVFEIEDAFNEIWGIRQRRGMVKRITVSLVLIITCPVIIIGTIMLNSFVAANAGILAGSWQVLEAVLRYVLVGGVFACMYIFVPYSPARIIPSLTSGLFTSVDGHFTQWVFIEFQVGVSRYNAIYGTFASLPLFLLWVYTSWFIVLMGCEFAFATQNEKKFAEEKFARHASYRLVRHLAVGVYFYLFRQRGGTLENCTAAAVARYFDAPVRMVQDILFKLVRGGLLVEGKMEKSPELVYLRGEGSDTVCPLDVIRALDDYGIDNLMANSGANPILHRVTGMFREEERALAGSGFKKTFRKHAEALESTS